MALTLLKVIPIMANLIKAKYHTESRAVEFIADDGRHYIRSGGTLPWRTFNCGDLASPETNGVPTPKKTKNFIGFASTSTGYHFFIFPSYEIGREQLEASLRRKYNNKSIRDMVNAYCPAKDKANKVEDYIQKIEKLTGFGEAVVLNTLSKSQLDSLMDAIERIEGYHGQPETRKEVWINVSNVQATDGVRPVAEAEVVVKSNGKETVLKSDATGRFPPIVHGTGPVEVFHKTIDGKKKPLGELPAGKGQYWSLVTKISEFFSKTGPVKAPANPIPDKQVLAYTVGPGDSLSKLAARFKVSVEQIKKDNRLVKDMIHPGQILGIHGAVSQVPAAAVPKKVAKRPVAKPAAAQPAAAKPAAAKPPPPVETAENVTTSARSKEGKGEPVALVDMESGVAPWMKFALAEAKRHQGAKEKEIEKEINYHTEVRTGRKSLDGGINAWCAAFVNWCLMKSGYPIENPKFADKTGEKGRANGFLQVRGVKTDKKQKLESIPLVANPLYKIIKEPVYGAIAIVTKPGGYGKHVGLVYGRIDDNHLAILGGNQSDMINFIPANIKPTKKNGNVEAQLDSLVFVLPIAYYPEKLKDATELKMVKIVELNESIGISRTKKIGPRSLT
jgi:uncharacterized protein (TIGR02594 family)